MSPLASVMVLDELEEFHQDGARRCGFVAAHAGCAPIAFSTATRTSIFEASGTRETASLVMGSKPSQKRPDVPLACLPSIKWVSSFVGASPLLSVSKSAAFFRDRTTSH